MKTNSGKNKFDIFITQENLTRLKLLIKVGDPQLCLTEIKYILMEMYNDGKGKFADHAEMTDVQLNHSSQLSLTELWAKASDP